MRTTGSRSVSADVGGFPEHRRLFESIVDGFGPTRVRRVAIEQSPPGLVDRGVQFSLLQPKDGDPRAEWEAWLMVGALRHAAKRDGLEDVVLFERGNGRTNLSWLRAPVTPLSAQDVARMSEDVARGVAAASAELESLDVLRPSGHALAVVVRVREPHRFLRYHFGPFNEPWLAWHERCGRQIYLEVRDDRDEPVLVKACHSNGCRTRVRKDAECCDPLVRIGRPLVQRAPAPCPVFGARE
jgi:hypothetical protein